MAKSIGGWKTMEIWRAPFFLTEHLFNLGLLDGSHVVFLRSSFRIVGSGGKILGKLVGTNIHDQKNVAMKDCQ